MEEAVQQGTQEISPQEISPNANATLIEQRGHAMLQDRYAGLTNQQIAFRYGLSEDAVDDLIRAALDDALAKRDHLSLQAGLIERLGRLDVELAELDVALPLSATRSFQALTSKGEIKTLWEEVCNAPTKLKIKAERRQNVLATKAILATDTGEATNHERERELNEIASTLGAVAREVVSEITQQALEKAEEVGKLQAQASPVITIDAKPIDEENKDE